MRNTTRPYALKCWLSSEHREKRKVHGKESSGRR
jgi:hypothetical protein